VREFINILVEATLSRERSTINSQGRIIASTPEGIEQFWRWFGKSRLKDRDGRPLVVYHGTTGAFRAFDPEMSNSHTNTGVPHSAFAFTDTPDVAISYITQDADRKDFARPEYREQFRQLIKNGDFDAQMKFLHDHPVLPNPEYKDGGNVLPVYLKITKPLIVDAKGYHWHDIYFQPREYDRPESFTTNEIAEYAIDNGYDGLIIKRVKDIHKGMAHASTVYFVFSPEQIKSAIANRGGFRQDAKEIDESYGESPTVRYDSKPAYMLHYEDSGTEAPVYENPSLNTFSKIIEACRGQARGIIYQDGTILIWDRLDLYHQDVYEQVRKPGDFITVMFCKNEVTLKSGQEEPIPAVEDASVAGFVPLIYGLRLLQKYYGSDEFSIMSENWW
jgi:hypothetical protein